MRFTTRSVRPIIAAIAIAVGVGWLVSTPRAQSTGQSYTTLQSGYTQELYGVTGDFDPGNPLAILGGVAFAPDGDVWSSECVFLGTRLHRFDQHGTYTANGTTLHPETIVDLTATAFGAAGGCGMVNHPNGFMYSNSSAGIWELHAETGQPIGAPIAHPTQTDTGGGASSSISMATRSAAETGSGSRSTPRPKISSTSAMTAIRRSPTTAPSARIGTWTRCPARCRCSRA